jgi:hypothetical protein
MPFAPTILVALLFCLNKSSNDSLLIGFDIILSMPHCLHLASISISKVLGD